MLPIIYYTSIMIEIELPNKTRKNILIEKNNCIKFASDFRISDKQDMRKISLDGKKYTLKQILEETRERIGNNIFFNWQISRNNCQMLVKEILIPGLITHLKQRRRPHAAADTHGLHAVFYAALPHIV